MLLVEMKSSGQNLGRAYDQVIDYLSDIKEHDLPRYVLVCNFQCFQLRNLTAQTVVKFQVKDLYQNIKFFWFYRRLSNAGHQGARFGQHQSCKLHDGLKAVGYTSHELECIWYGCYSACLQKTLPSMKSVSFSIARSDNSVAKNAGENRDGVVAPARFLRSGNLSAGKQIEISCVKSRCKKSSVSRETLLFN